MVTFTKDFREFRYVFTRNKDLEEDPYEEHPYPHKEVRIGLVLLWNANGHVQEDPLHEFCSNLEYHWIEFEKHHGKSIQK